MKVIFLDIDGVLNGHEWDDEAKSCSIRRECVKHLCRVVRETDAKVVISSAWRYMILGGDMTDRGFGYMLRTHGLISGHPGPVVIGHTEPDQIVNCPEERALQVREWLANHPDVKSYVVIDDEDFGYRMQAMPFVHTDGTTGMTSADADLAIAHLLELDP